MDYSNKRILVIEDHKSIRVLLGSMLRKQNYNVTTKKDGFEGMVWLGEGNIPDLILLDIHMPMLSGNEFLHSIKNSGFYKDIPVLILSGSEEESEITQCINLGARGFLKKPFKPSTLHDKIGSILTPQPSTIIN